MVFPEKKLFFYFFCSHAYMINLKCAKILLNKAIGSGPDGHMKNLIEQNIIKAYAFQPGIFMQGN